MDTVDITGVTSSKSMTVYYTMELRTIGSSTNPPDIHSALIDVSSIYPMSLYGMWTIMA